MNKRKFIRTLGAVAVGCMLAGGLCWKRENKLVANPEWVNATYEVRFIHFLDKRLKFPQAWPARSNNPHALRDNDFIPPFIIK